MYQGLGRLVQIPLQVAVQTGVIVVDPQQQRCFPLPGTGQHLERSVVEIQVPEPMGIFGLKTSDFAAFQPLLSLLGTRRVALGTALTVLNPIPVNECSCNLLR